MTIKSIDLSKTDEADWLAMRHPFVGASESPVLVGDSYAGDTVWDLWHKKQQPPPAPNDYVDDRIWFGRMLQPVFGEYIRRRLAWDLAEPRSLLIDEERRMSATLDFVVDEPGTGKGVVETKNRDYMIWRDRYTDDDAWIYDKVQLAHQMLLVPEAAFGAIVVLVGGNEIKTYRYAREDLAEIMGGLPTVIENFWRSVEQREEPDILAADLPTWALERGPVDMLETLDLPEDLDEVLQRYRLASEAASTNKKTAEDAKAQIIQALGNHCSGLSPHHRVALKASRVSGTTVTPDMVGSALKKEHYRHNLTVSVREDAPDDFFKPYDEAAAQRG